MDQPNVSCLIVFVCNPYIAVLQKQTYLKYWKKDVDEVLINVNGRNQEVIDFIVNLWKDDDKVTVCWGLFGEMRQGVAFDSMMPAVTGKVLMTLDSDNFIYKEDVVRRMSNMILTDQYQAVGSEGYHAKPPEFANILIKRYTTVRLNPFMSFWNMSTVMRLPNITCRTLNIKRGEILNELGKVPCDSSLDVMAYFSLQFFNLTSKFCKIKQTTEGEYVHVGSLSSIYRRNFKNIENANTTKRERSLFRQHSSYWTWYWLIYEKTKKEVTIPGYNEEYEKMFNWELEKAKTSMDDIRGNAKTIVKTHPGLFD